VTRSIPPPPLDPNVLGAEHYNTARDVQAC